MSTIEHTQTLVSRWQSPEGTAELQRILTCLRRGESTTSSIEGADEVTTGKDLRGAPMAGESLAGIDLSDWRLEEANLASAILEGASLERAGVSEANLHGTDLSRARLRGARLDGADLRDANLTGADLRHANLYGARLEGAVLDGADLSFATREESGGVEPEESGEASSRLALDAAVEDLYETFGRYRAPATPSHSPVLDVSPELIAELHHTPLRKCGRKALQRYAFHAINTWGDEDELRYFLPRILELAARGNWNDVGAVLAKLSIGRWRTWPQSEQDAIEQYVCALFQHVLTIFPANPPPHEIIWGMAVADDAVPDLLETWFDSDQRTALLLLADWVHLERDDLWRGGRPGDYWPEPVRSEAGAMLRRPAIRDKLERAYFDDPEAPGAVSLASASDILSGLPTEA